MCVCLRTQDIEFTVQEGKLFMLQCRSGKRTGGAAVKIAVDLVNEKLVTPDQAIMMVCGEHTYTQYGMRTLCCARELIKLSVSSKSLYMPIIYVKSWRVMCVAGA